MTVRPGCWRASRDTPPVDDGTLTCDVVGGRRFDGLRGGATTSSEIGASSAEPGSDSASDAGAGSMTRLAATSASASPSRTKLSAPVPTCGATRIVVPRAVTVTP
jgi:hypothetical protein